MKIILEKEITLNNEPNYDNDEVDLIYKNIISENPSILEAK